ncbi:MAG: hypothetical protein E7376_03895 [Clostridiales bacterium]|nr:hypothetical protein [Clostridiales bacterium]
MKKILCIILLSSLLFCISGCSNQIADLIKENMSDLRINYFVGENENMFANLSCGYREQTFAYDGISTQKVECGVLSVGFNTIYSYSSISVILIVDNIEQEYVLQHSPYENVYMVDIEKILTEENIISLKLKNSANELSLNNVSNSWNVQYDKALNIAGTTLQDELNLLYFNGKFNAEGYLKIVSKKDFEKTYWYFSYIDRSGNSNSLLIDVQTGEVTKREI